MAFDLRHLNQQLHDLDGENDTCFSYWNSYCKALVDHGYAMGQDQAVIAGRRRFIDSYGHRLFIQFSHDFATTTIQYIACDLDLDGSYVNWRVINEIQIDERGKFVGRDEYVSDTSACVGFHMRTLLDHFRPRAT